MQILQNYIKKLILHANTKMIQFLLERKEGKLFKMFSYTTNANKLKGLQLIKQIISALL